MSTIGLNIRIPKQSLIKLSNHQNQQLLIHFNGGRQVYGKLKSWDKTMNLVLDNSYQILSIENNEQIKRQLGLIIVKGSQIQSIALKNHYLLIENPYQNGQQQQQDQEQQQQSEQQKDKEK